MPLARSAALSLATSIRASRSIVATTAERLAGSATNGVAHVRRLGPAVEVLGRGLRPLGARRQPAELEHPRELAGEQHQRRHRGGVVGLIEAAVVAGDGEVERGRAPPSRGGDAVDAFDRRRRAGGDPQPAVGGEALLRGEVVDVDVGRRPTAGRRPPTWRRRGRAGRRSRPSGRRSCIATPVEVSLWVRA